MGGHRIRDFGGERAPVRPRSSPMGEEARSQTEDLSRVRRARMIVRATLDKGRSGPQAEVSKFGRTTFAPARSQSPTLTQSLQKSKLDDDFASRSRVAMLAS